MDINITNSSSKNNTTTNAFVWKLLERFGVATVQFVLQVLLARLLSPEHYGALTIMIIFTTLANVFIQNGFNTALIQNKDVTEEDYSSVFWVSIFIAVILYATIFALSPVIAVFYKMPDIVNPLRVLALILFPGALNSVQLAKVSREMNFKKVFYSNIVGVVISGVIGIVVAILGGGLWALVVQSVVNVFAACIVMRFTVHLKLRFCCNIRRIKMLFSYGWKLLVSSLLDTLYQDINNLVIGKKYASDTLGYYNRGQQFPQFIINAINGAIQSVLLPAMSAHQDDKNKVKTMTRNSVTISSYAIFPIMAGLAAVAPSLIELLLTEKWLPCVPYLQVCCVTFAFYPIHSSNLQAINAVGRSDIFLKLEIIKKAVSLVFLAIAVIFFDSPLAIAISGAIGVPIGLFINAFPNKKLIDYFLLEQMKDIAPSFIVSLVMCALVWSINLLNINLVIKLITQIILGIAVYVLLSLIFRLKPFVIICNMIKNILNKKKDTSIKK